MVTEMRFGRLCRFCCACECELEEDERSYCQDCWPILHPPGYRRQKDVGIAPVRRLHYLRRRAEKGLPLFEESERGK